MSRNLPVLIRITGTHTNVGTSEETTLQTGASTAEPWLLVGTAINDVYATPIPMRSDSDGKLYFKPGFDSGSDNDGDYEFWLQMVRG